MYNYATDYLKRELCINEAFHRTISTILTSLVENALNTNTYSPSYNTTGAFSNTVATESSFNDTANSPSASNIPVLTRTRNSAGVIETRKDSAYFTILAWELKFIKTRFSKKNSDFYHDHFRVYKAIFETVSKNCKLRLTSQFELLSSKLNSVMNTRMTEIERRKTTARKKLLKHVNSICEERLVNKSHCFPIDLMIQLC